MFSVKKYILPMTETVNTKTASFENSKPMQKRALETRRRVLEAVITCLDKHGFSETSINAIQSQAGLSRGSMSHHFPTRQAMVVAAAELMLENTTKNARQYFNSVENPNDPASSIELVKQFWTKTVNTVHGRAFIEVMLASRTDTELRDSLRQKLEVWEKEIDGLMSEYYGDQAVEVGILWEICRSFFHGLLFSSYPAKDPALAERMIETFAEMFGRQLSDQMHKLNGT